MKLLWFHMMSYTDLPEDFMERHSSVCGSAGHMAEIERPDTVASATFRFLA